MNTANTSSLSGSQNPPTGGVPSDNQHYLGSDLRLHTKIGERQGQTMRTTGRSGLLVYGPYAAFSAGTYQLIVKGTAQSATDGSWLDVACDLGQKCLIKTDIPAANSTGEWIATAEFVLDLPVKNIETRVWVPATADLTLLSISIVRAAAKSTSTVVPVFKLPSKQIFKNKRR
jgi:hypothetical protein